MSNELWWFLLGIWVWQGVSGIIYIVFEGDERVFCWTTMGLWLVPLGIILTPVKWVREFRRRGGYTWSLLRAPDGEIVRVRPQKRYRYRGISNTLTEELRGIGYQFITRDDAEKLIEGYPESPWSKEVNSGFGINVRYSPWVVAKQFPKIVVTKKIKEQLDEENRKWEESKGDGE